MLMTFSAVTLSENEEISTNAIKLTNQNAGIFKALCVLAFPLMLSSLSGTLLLFIDRLVLSHYSTDAMNAVASASLIFAILQFTSVSIASIAEIFVGQFNGAKQYHQLAKPVWQMIWFSLMTIVPFFMVGLFGCDLLLPIEMSEHGKPFLSTMMFFGPLFPLNAALASFFIGQGKVKLVTLAILATSIVNFILLFVLIFGFLGIPALGTLGAAWATGIAQFFGLFVLIYAFLNQENRQKYKTNQWQFDSILFKQCLKIGLPNAIGHMIAIVAWALVMILLAKISMDHITIFTISQGIWQFFAFITDGIQKAVSTLCANFIGANKKKMLNHILQSGIRLHLIISLFLLFPLVFFPEFLIQAFLSNDVHITNNKLFTTAITSCQLLWLSLLFDGIVWVISGILTAAGDTRFIMIMNAVNSWIFGIVPFYILMVYFDSPPIVSIHIIIAFSLFNMMSFILRFRDKTWQQKEIMPLSA